MKGRTTLHNNLAQLTTAAPLFLANSFANKKAEWLFFTAVPVLSDGFRVTSCRFVQCRFRNLLIIQECIPVGCVPPLVDCIPACTAGGVCTCVPAGGYLPGRCTCQGRGTCPKGVPAGGVPAKGGVPARGCTCWGVLARGVYLPGGTCTSTPPCEQVQKYYLAPIFLCGR